VVLGHRGNTPIALGKARIIPRSVLRFGPGAQSSYVKNPDARHLSFSHPSLMAQTQLGAAPRASPQPERDEHAIRIVGLPKRYGAATVLDALNLMVNKGRYTAISDPTAPAIQPPSGCCSGCTADRRPRRTVRDRRLARTVAAHTHVAYVPGEPFLWPAVTSTETFELLARLHRQKAQMIAAFTSRAELLLLLLLLDEPTAGPSLEEIFLHHYDTPESRVRTAPALAPLIPPNATGSSSSLTRGRCR
jgi:hypothetical protein